MYISNSRLQYFPNLILNKLRISKNGVIEEFEQVPDDINSLYVHVDEEIPDYDFDISETLMRYKNLRILSIPYYLIPKIQQSILLRINVICIYITDNITKDENAKVLANIVSHSIKSIIFSFEYPSIRIESLLGITPANFPNLEYLNCRIDKGGKILECIKPFKSLRFLEVEYVGNNKLFDVLSNNLEYLIIYGSESNFQFEDISKLTNLHAVLLNGIKSEIDCSRFKLLPELMEICIWNSKKISNVESLLDCPQIKSLSIINCGRPFKKCKEKFIADNYELLDIQYS